MPRVVYGIMSFHMTHEISVPDPRLTASASVPNACSQCHLDRSLNWALSETARLWPRRFGAVTPNRDPAFDVAEGVRALLAGDALTRAMAADALGGGPTAIDGQWAASFLLEAFNDNYPVVRFFAAQGLARTDSARSGLPSLDYLGPAHARQAAVAKWWARHAAARPHVAALAERLRARRVNVDIEVGE